MLCNQSYVYHSKDNLTNRDTVQLIDTLMDRSQWTMVHGRIPTVKLKIPGKSRIQKFCNIQVIVFDFIYLPVAAVGT